MSHKSSHNQFQIFKLLFLYFCFKILIRPIEMTPYHLRLFKVTFPTYRKLFNLLKNAFNRDYAEKTWFSLFSKISCLLSIKIEFWLFWPFSRIFDLRCSLMTSGLTFQKTNVKSFTLIFYLSSYSEDRWFWPFWS